MKKIASNTRSAKLCCLIIVLQYSLIASAPVHSRPLQDSLVRETRRVRDPRNKGMWSIHSESCLVAMLLLHSTFLGQTDPPFINTHTYIGFQDVMILCCDCLKKKQVKRAHYLKETLN